MAQSGSALALGASGRKFKSYYPDQAPVAQLDRATGFLNRGSGVRISSGAPLPLL
tara:strand:+ start:194 stop:358 length:165 start_codon:yes stop_codon:yes gene_type:complete